MLSLKSKIFSFASLPPLNLARPAFKPTGTIHTQKVRSVVLYLGLPTEPKTTRDGARKTLFKKLQNGMT